MGKSSPGQGIAPSRCTAEQIAALDDLVREAEAAGDLDTWRRSTAIRRYIDGKRVVVICEELGVARSTINTWMCWYNALGADGLRTRKAPGRAPRLSQEQRAELIVLIEAGPQACGFTAGIWTGPMIGSLILERFGVQYHNHHVPRLLNQLGFSVQRPRKRLARADQEQQAKWINERLPEIKKKRLLAEGRSSSRTRPASGSTERSTRPGPRSGSSRG